MDLSKLPIFKAGWLRQAKYLISTPQKAQDALEILETGVVGIESLPMQTGFLTATDKTVKKAWGNVHALKVQIYKDGKPTERSAAIPISERSYIPLDPLDLFKQKAREKLASLDDIALSRHDEAMADTTPSTREQIQRMIINIGFTFLFFLAVVYFLRGC